VAISPQRAFGNRIRELRAATGMTQEDLAERCGLFRTYMSRIETGKANPTLTMIHALAGSLSVEVTALFGAPPELDKRAKPASARTGPSRGRVSR
jgi:transcriptional regulator with XRE-family HTH domain